MPALSPVWAIFRTNCTQNRILGLAGLRDYSDDLASSQFFSVDNFVNLAGGLQFTDYYDLLQVAKGASDAEIKAAYRQQLLLNHPDKNKLVADEKDTGLVAIDLLKTAYQTLCSPALRSLYDAALASDGAKSYAQVKSRPAQIISLDDFEEAKEGIWSHRCRCGGKYTITEEELVKAQHIVGCDSCSEVVFVGFEAVEEDMAAF